MGTRDRPIEVTTRLRWPDSEELCDDVFRLVVARLSACQDWADSCDDQVELIQPTLIHVICLLNSEV